MFPNYFHFKGVGEAPKLFLRGEHFIVFVFVLF
jgi:hypothetical protein